MKCKDCLKSIVANEIYIYCILVSDKPMIKVRLCVDCYADRIKIDFPTVIPKDSKIIGRNKYLRNIVYMPSISGQIASILSKSFNCTRFNEEDFKKEVDNGNIKGILLI